jgi:hypothetical protein
MMDLHFGVGYSIFIIRYYRLAKLKLLTFERVGARQNYPYLHADKNPVKKQ